MWAVVGARALVLRGGDGWRSLGIGLATDSESGTQIMDTLAGWPNTAERYGKKFGPERSGHITKAHNVPCGELLQADGTFKSLQALREYFGTKPVRLSLLSHPSVRELERQGQCPP